MTPSLFRYLENVAAFLSEGTAVTDTAVYYDQRGFWAIRLDCVESYRALKRMLRVLDFGMVVDSWECFRGNFGVCQWWMHS